MDIIQESQTQQSTEIENEISQSEITHEKIQETDRPIAIHRDQNSTLTPVTTKHEKSGRPTDLVINSCDMAPVYNIQNSGSLSLLYQVDKCTLNQQGNMSEGEIELPFNSKAWGSETKQNLNNQTTSNKTVIETVPSFSAEPPNCNTSSLKYLPVTVN